MFDSPLERHQERKKSPLTWWLLVATALVVFGFVYYVTFGPNPPIRVSKATTHITTPLADDGLPDYAAALIAELSRGVTPENNGAVPLIQAMWPEGDDAYSSEDEERMLKELGLRAPPHADTRIDNFWSRPVRREPARLYRSRVMRSGSLTDEPVSETHDFGADSLIISNESAFWQATDEEAAADERSYDLLDLARAKPWTAEDLPFADRWVSENSTGLDRLLAAAERSHFYLPDPAALAGGRGAMLEGFFPGFIVVRRACSYLQMRSFRCLGEKRYDPAMRQAVAILKLASHVGRGRLMLDQLVANAMAGLGRYTVHHLAADPRVPPGVLRSLLAELRGLQAPMDMQRTVLGERYLTLDSLLAADRDGLLVVDEFSQVTDQVAGIASKTSIDWNFALQKMNSYYDSLELAFKEPTRKRRHDAVIAAHSAIESSHDRVEAERRDPLFLLTPADRSELIADACLASLEDHMRFCLRVAYRGSTEEKLTCLAVAISVYRAEQGSYPETLDQLVPAILPETPVDPLHDQAFVYRRTEGGYLLYSVGPNGVDDGGSNAGYEGGGSGNPTFEGIEVDTFFDESSDTLTAEEQAAYDLIEKIPTGADDISLRMPLPVEPWPWEKQ